MPQDEGAPPLVLMSLAIFMTHLISVLFQDQSLMPEGIQEACFNQPKTFNKMVESH